MGIWDTLPPQPKNVYRFQRLTCEYPGRGMCTLDGADILFQLGQGREVVEFCDEPGGTDPRLWALIEHLNDKTCTHTERGTPPGRRDPKVCSDCSWKLWHIIGFLRGSWAEYAKSDALPAWEAEKQLSRIIATFAADPRIAGLCSESDQAILNKALGLAARAHEIVEAAEPDDPKKQIAETTELDDQLNNMRQVAELEDSWLTPILAALVIPDGEDLEPILARLKRVVDPFVVVGALLDAYTRETGWTGKPLTAAERKAIIAVVLEDGRDERDEEDDDA